METIFHDVPFKAGFKPFSKLKMDGKVTFALSPGNAHDAPEAES